MPINDADIRRLIEARNALQSSISAGTVSGQDADTALWQMNDQLTGLLRGDVEAPSTRGNENRELGHTTGPDTEPRALRSSDRLYDWAQRNAEIPADQTSAGQRELSFARLLRGMTDNNWHGAELERRAMNETTTTAGGFLVPTLLSTQIIDLARNQSRVLQAGATVYPMANSKVDIAKWAADPAFTWHTENATITPTDATLAKVTLTAKALPCIVQVSRELVEDSDPTSVEQALRDAFAAQVALGLDLACLYGTGAPQPLGIKGTSGITITPMQTNGHSFDGTAGFRYEPIVNAVGRVRSANEDANGILYSPRTGVELGLMVDSTGQPLQVPPYLDAIPRYETNQIPNNLVVGTSGSNCSDIFVGDWSQLIVGIRTGLQIQVLTERYVDTGMIGFSAWSRFDCVVARAAAFQIVSGVL